MKGKKLNMDLSNADFSTMMLNMESFLKMKRREDVKSEKHMVVKSEWKKGNKE